MKIGRGWLGMDVRERISAGLPRSIDDLEAAGPHETADLWLLARAYSRLRHRTPPGRGRTRLEDLKLHCIRMALAREPDLFVVAIDPGFPNLRFVYHHQERNLLHVPVHLELCPAPIS